MIGSANQETGRQQEKSKEDGYTGMIADRQFSNNELIQSTNLQSLHCKGGCLHLIIRIAGMLFTERSFTLQLHLLQSGNSSKPNPISMNEDCMKLMPKEEGQLKQRLVIGCVSGDVKLFKHCKEEWTTSIWQNFDSTVPLAHRSVNSVEICSLSSKKPSQRDRILFSNHVSLKSIDKKNYLKMECSTLQAKHGTIRKAFACNEILITQTDQENSLNRFYLNQKKGWLTFGTSVQPKHIAQMKHTEHISDSTFDYDTQHLLFTKSNSICLSDNNLTLNRQIDFEHELNKVHPFDLRKERYNSFQFKTKSSKDTPQQAFPQQSFLCSSLSKPELILGTFFVDSTAQIDQTIQLQEISRVFKAGDLLKNGKRWIFSAHRKGYEIFLEDINGNFVNHDTSNNNSLLDDGDLSSCEFGEFSNQQEDEGLGQFLVSNSIGKVFAISVHQYDAKRTLMCQANQAMDMTKSYYSRPRFSSLPNSSSTQNQQKSESDLNRKESQLNNDPKKENIRSGLNENAEKTAAIQRPPRLKKKCVNTNEETKAGEQLEKQDNIIEKVEEKILSDEQKTSVDNQQKSGSSNQIKQEVEDLEVSQAELSKTESKFDFLKSKDTSGEKQQIMKEKISNPLGQKVQSVKNFTLDDDMMDLEKNYMQTMSKLTQQKQVPHTEKFNNQQDLQQQYSSTSHTSKQFFRGKNGFSSSANSNYFKSSTSQSQHELVRKSGTIVLDQSDSNWQKWKCKEIKSLQDDEDEDELIKQEQKSPVKNKETNQINTTEQFHEKKSLNIDKKDNLNERYAQLKLQEELVENEKQNSNQKIKKEHYQFPQKVEEDYQKKITDFNETETLSRQALKERAVNELIQNEIKVQYKNPNKQQQSHQEVISVVEKERINQTKSTSEQQNIVIEPFKQKEQIYHKSSNSSQMPDSISTSKQTPIIIEESYARRGRSLPTNRNEEGSNEHVISENKKAQERWQKANDKEDTINFINEEEEQRIDSKNNLRNQNEKLQRQQQNINQTQNKEQNNKYLHQPKVVLQENNQEQSEKQRKQQLLLEWEQIRNKQDVDNLVSFQKNSPQKNRVLDQQQPQNQFQQIPLNNSNKPNFLDQYPVENNDWKQQQSTNQMNNLIQNPKQSGQEETQLSQKNSQVQLNQNVGNARQKSEAELLKKKQIEKERNKILDEDEEWDSQQKQQQQQKNIENLRENKTNEQEISKEKGEQMINSKIQPQQKKSNIHQQIRLQLNNNEDREKSQINQPAMTKLQQQQMLSYSQKPAQMDQISPKKDNFFLKDKILDKIEDSPMKQSKGIQLQQQQQYQQQQQQKQHALNSDQDEKLEIRKAQSVIQGINPNENKDLNLEIKNRSSVPQSPRMSRLKYSTSVATNVVKTRPPCNPIQANDFDCFIPQKNLISQTIKSIADRQLSNDAKNAQHSKQLRSSSPYTSFSGILGTSTPSNFDFIDEKSTQTSINMTSTTINKRPMLFQSSQNSNESVSLTNFLSEISPEAKGTTTPFFRYVFPGKENQKSTLLESTSLKSSIQPQGLFDLPSRSFRSSNKRVIQPESENNIPLLLKGQKQKTPLKYFDEEIEDVAWETNGYGEEQIRNSNHSQFKTVKRIRQYDFFTNNQKDVHFNLDNKKNYEDELDNNNNIDQFDEDHDLVSILKYEIGQLNKQVQELESALSNDCHQLSPQVTSRVNQNNNDSFRNQVTCSIISPVGVSINQVFVSSSNTKCFNLVNANQDQSISITEVSIEGERSAAFEICQENIQNQESNLTCSNNELELGVDLQEEGVGGSLELISMYSAIPELAWMNSVKLMIFPFFTRQKQLRYDDFVGHQLIFNNVTGNTQAQVMNQIAMLVDNGKNRLEQNSDKYRWKSTMMGIQIQACIEKNNSIIVTSNCLQYLVQIKNRVSRELVTELIPSKVVLVQGAFKSQFELAHVQIEALKKQEEFTFIKNFIKEITMSGKRTSQFRIDYRGLFQLDWNQLEEHQGHFEEVSDDRKAVIESSVRRNIKNTISTCLAIGKVFTNTPDVKIIDQMLEQLDMQTLYIYLFSN